MSALIRWQFFSILSRFAAVGIGIVQSVFIVRLLSPDTYGLVGVVVAVGSLAGIILHLGLVSGATREIAAARSEEDAFKVFASALVVRMAVALPIFTALFEGANLIAGSIYHHPEIAQAVRLYAAILLIQAPQGIFNAALFGLKRFKPIFIFQVTIAVISLSLFVPLTYYFGFYGYFWAMLCLAAINTLSLLVLTWRSFQVKWLWPKLPEIKAFARKILSVGLAIYLVKIIFTAWQRFGPLVLGREASAFEVGIFSFALFYSSKLMTASDAVTDVSLPVFSEHFSCDLEKFRTEFAANFEKIFSLVTLVAGCAILWSPELIYLIAGNKYQNALPLVPLLVFCFWAYSFMNIIKSSVMIPAKLGREMVISYALLLAMTVLGFFGLRRYDLLKAVVWGMSLGASSALLWQWLAVRRRLELAVFDRKSAMVILVLSPLLFAYPLSLPLLPKLLVFGSDLVCFSYILRRLAIFDWANTWAQLRKRLRYVNFFSR